MNEAGKNINKHRHKKKAFTLIEIIVVLGIIGIMLGMSIPFFATFTKSAKLKNAAVNISTVLRTARSYAIARRKNYMVIIHHKESENSPSDAVKIYQIEDGTIGKWYELPQGITIDSVTNYENTLASVPFPGDTDSPEDKQVVEFKSTGGVKHACTIYIKDSKNKYRAISIIGTTGRIKITNDEPE